MLIANQILFDLTIFRNNFMVGKFTVVFSDVMAVGVCKDVMENPYTPKYRCIKENYCSPGASL